MNIRTKIIALTLAFNLVSCVIIGSIGFYFLNQATKKLVGENALSIVLSVSRHIDGAKFAELTRSLDKRDPYYEELRSYLERLKNEMGAKYLYTMSGVSETELMYVVDGTDPGDVENFSDLGKQETVENLSGEEPSVLKEGLKTYTDIYSTPDWGDLISAYAPIYNGEGRIVGLVGCDFPPNIITEKNEIPFMRRVIVGATVFLIAMSFVSILILVNVSFKRPIGLLNEKIGRLSTGDLTVDLQFDSQNEIGSIFENLGATTASMKKVVSEVQVISVSLASATDEMSATTMSTSQNIARMTELQSDIIRQIDETRNTVGHIAESTARQFSIYSRLNDRILDLSATIESSNSQTQQSLALAGDISAKIQTGEADLNRLSAIMDNINSSSEEMNDIVAFINEISDKINLLSLNAAIESARAGEAGRGFAVVADEISKLADSTASSIKDIDRLIESNHAQTISGLENLQAIVVNMKSVVADVSVISRNIETMSRLMAMQLEYRSGAHAESEKMKSISDEINELISRHGEATEEIQKSITDIGSMGQVNAASSEELAANSEEIAAMADSLKHLASVFKT
jgi:methyl-accepting chemotaxis protein